MILKIGEHRMAGQINRGQALGEHIYSLALDINNKQFLEIGTWNGQGSTKCFIDALVTRTDDYMFISLESEKGFFESATAFHQSVLGDQIQIIHGKIIESNEVISQNLNNVQEQWLSADLNNYSSCPNVIDMILEYQYDVVLLDGGEFSTYAEFLKLKEITKTLILDDTNELKNQKVLQVLNNDSRWQAEIISNDRNGFAIYRNVEYARDRKVRQ